MSIRMDAHMVEREKAQSLLNKLKEEEVNKKHYVWMGHGLIVSHGTMKGLREMVEGAGYEWDEGTLGE